MFNACVKSSLELVDEMLGAFFASDVLKGFTKYFASVSKVCNVWREKAKEMCDTWENLHEDCADLEVCKLGRRYPLAVISGRWGSIEAAEDFLLLRGRHAVSESMLRVLARHMKADKGLPTARSYFVMVGVGTCDMI